MSEYQTTGLTLSRNSSMTGFPMLKSDLIMSPLSHFRQEYVDVVAIFLPKYEKELIPNVRVLMKENNDIDLNDLLKSLSFMGFPVERNMISYYSYSHDLFVYCGKEPLPLDSVVPGRDIASFNEKNQITIRIRQSTYLPFTSPELSIHDEVISTKLEFEEASTNPDINSDEQIPNIPSTDTSATKHKRTKERKIGQVIDRVLYWRKLYTGYNDAETGAHVKMSLEEAATKIGISKKSLDDYLLQIRFGKKYGFNFNEHYNDRVGILRAFVKKYKGTARIDRDGSKDPKMPQELAQLLEKKDAKSKQNKDPDFQPTVGLCTRSRKISK